MTEDEAKQKWWLIAEEKAEREAGLLWPERRAELVFRLAWKYYLQYTTKSGVG